MVWEAGRRLVWLCFAHLPGVEEEGWKAIFPALISPGTSLQPSSHTFCCLGESERSFGQQGGGGVWHPLSSLPVPGGSEGPSRSLSSRLVIAGTRLLSWHRGHIKGLSSLAPRPKQVPALGTHPRACPSMSRSSCWHQPGCILAF